MAEKTIAFGGFEFSVEKGLEYLVNEQTPETDFLLINEPGDGFSMTFEKDFPIFSVPEKAERDYCLFELKRSDRVIKFFCPEKRENLNTAVWYFYVEIFDTDGNAHVRRGKGKPRFIEVLERVKLGAACA